jgi:hypothetical protein
LSSTPCHRAVNAFSPHQALGAGVDRLETGSADKLLADLILKEVLGAGWQSVTYRQNTELHAEGWYWNPRGDWSNPERHEGYFTGSAEPAEMVRQSWAYPLPHRGFSRGDGNG